MRRIFPDVRGLARFGRQLHSAAWRRARWAAGSPGVTDPRSKRWGGIRGSYHRLRYALAVRFGSRESAREAICAAARITPDDDHLQYALSVYAVSEAEREQAMSRALAIRSRRLPPTLAQGLAAVRANPPSASYPAASAWAWRNLAPPQMSHGEWRRRAHFGWASNLLIWDWANCARDRLAELDALIISPDAQVERLLRSQNRGVLLVHAHVGVLPASPHYLRSLRPRVRILAAVPPTRVTDTLDFYIDSTLPLSLRQVLRDLDRGISIALFPDSRRGIHFAETALPGGAGLRVAQWIPRLIWRHGVRYLYCFPLWEGERIRMVFELDTCRPEQGEPYEEWESRFVHHYRARVLAALQSAPENLRLTGGFWEQFA
ncbi:hypothetical protein [Bradyrhizobium sp.]|uniref:hypothetical protein n=1 Tax=Bradyrhizobium sp. TaxID=376 RepID=UPI002E05AE04|nr:hypothetical protein [Bradyrhizobium sp.]